MASNKTKLTLALSSAIAASLAGTAAPAADNPFSAQALGKGYMVAAADEKPADKAKEGSCGDMKGGMKNKEGSCGDMKGMKKKRHRDCDAMKQKMKDSKPVDMDKAKEAKCGEHMKMDDKSPAKAKEKGCGGDMKMDGKAKEMNCGANMKMDDKK